MHVLELYYPNFRELSVHESSPVQRGASIKLARECKNHVPSQYDTTIQLGQHHPRHGYRSEDLENMTFEDESFDLVITQDVLEHLFDPEKAFAEIARTLKPGGAHIFTTPLVRKLKPSLRSAILDENGEVKHLEPPVYHANPVDRNGSLVTVQWGYDICNWIYESSGLFTTIFCLDNLELGIRAALIEVLVSIKNRE
jgi:SAM-dependent methyltransferase